MFSTISHKWYATVVFIGTPEIFTSFSIFTIYYVVLIPNRFQLFSIRGNYIIFAETIYTPIIPQTPRQVGCCNGVRQRQLYLRSPYGLGRSYHRLTLKNT